VLQASHAAELVIKARIAQEHPLLIFEQLPKLSQVTGAKLDFDDLFQKGRTLQWSDLPDRLWATTGVTLPNRTAYDAFGKLRNGIQHFGPPAGVEPSTETLRFVFEVIDPFINEMWDLYAVDYDEDDERYLYFVMAVVHREIPFLVSVEAAETFESWDCDWDKVSKDYRDLMHTRVKKALASKTSKK